MYITYEELVQVHSKTHLSTVSCCKCDIIIISIVCLCTACMSVTVPRNEMCLRLFARPDTVLIQS